EAPLGDHHGEVLLRVEGGELAEDRAEVGEADPAEARAVADVQAIDPELQEIRLNEPERLLHRRDEQREPEDAAVRPDVAPEPADQARVVRLAEVVLPRRLGRHQIASSSTSRAASRKISAYTPPRATRASCVPASTSRPSSRT